mgnify:CR=1 FL=1
MPWWPSLSGCGLNVVPTHGTAPCGKPVMMSGVHLWVSLLPTLQPCFSCTTLSHGDSVGPSFDTWIVPSGQDPDQTNMCKVSKQSRGHFGWKSPRLIATGGKYSTMSSMTSSYSHYASAKPGVACKYSMQIMELRDASLKYWSWTIWVEDDLGTNYFVLCLLSWIYCDILLTSSFRCRQGKQQQSLPTICQLCWFIHDSVHIRVRLNTSVPSFVFNFFISFDLFILLCIFINYYLLLFLLLTSLRHWRSMCIGTPVPRTHCTAASPLLVYLPKSNLFPPFSLRPVSGLAVRGFVVWHYSTRCSILRSPAWCGRSPIFFFRFWVGHNLEVLWQFVRALWSPLGDFV